MIIKNSGILPFQNTNYLFDSQKNILKIIIKKYTEYKKMYYFCIIIINIK